MTEHLVCTIAAQNYLPFVRVLSASLVKHNPFVKLVVLLVAEKESCVPLEKEGFHVLHPSEIGKSDMAGMSERYSIKQICAALKPVLLRHLLDQGVPCVTFLDPDIFVTKSLAPLFKMVARHSLTVTPHIHSYEDSARTIGLERSIRLAGIYNAGCLGVGNTNETLRFLDWWAERLRTHCLNAPQAGIHFDQRWLDHAMGFVEDVHILRDPGCNVAYWNIGDFTWRAGDGGFHVNDKPLRFFHFSGFDPLDSSTVSRFAPGLHTSQLGPLAKLFQHYATLLIQAGYGGAEMMRGG